MDLIEFYKQNEFLLMDGDKEVWFSINNQVNKKHFKTPFAIITASNPMNEELCDDENKIRNTQLEENLNALGYNHKPTVGRLGEHSEESFIIYNITQADALTIATFYEQYSIFYNDTKQLSYIECKKQIVLLSERVS